MNATDVVVSTLLGKNVKEQSTHYTKRIRKYMKSELLSYPHSDENNSIGDYRLPTDCEKQVYTNV